MARKVKSLSIKELKAKIKELSSGQVHHCKRFKKNEKGKNTDEVIEFVVNGSSHENSKYYQDLVAALQNKQERSKNAKSRN